MAGFSILEVGLFLYALGGAMSMGYWVLLNINPGFREQTRDTKFGYSFLAGGFYIFVVFLLAFALSEFRVLQASFLELFFWFVPILPLILGAVVMEQQAIALANQYRRGELHWPRAKPAEEKEKQLSPAEKGIQLGSSFQPRAPHAAAPAAAAPAVSGPKDQDIEIGESDENFWNKKEATATHEESPEDKQKMALPTEAGEQEQDVESEIARIMKGEKPKAIQLVKPFQASQPIPAFEAVRSSEPVSKSAVMGEKKTERPLTPLKKDIAIGGDEDEFWGGRESKIKTVFGPEQPISPKPVPTNKAIPVKAESKKDLESEMTRLMNESKTKTQQALAKKKAGGAGLGAATGTKNEEIEKIKQELKRKMKEEK